MMKKGFLFKFLFAMLILVLPLSANLMAAPEPASSELKSSTESVLTNQMISEEVAIECHTGTLLFSEGDCLTIRCYTWSPYTHVAIVVMEQGQPVVYDSMNGVGVRRLPLGEYIEWESYGSDNIVVMNPTEPFSKDQSDSLRTYLDAQLGRPYSVKHYVIGSENEGIHCSEYVSSALRESNILKVERPAKVSPASLYEGVDSGELYDVKLVSSLVRPVINREIGESWYNQAWLDTKFCYKVCHFKLATWVTKCK